MLTGIGSRYTDWLNNLLPNFIPLKQIAMCGLFVLITISKSINGIECHLKSNQTGDWSPGKQCQSKMTGQNANYMVRARRPRHPYWCQSKDFVVNEGTPTLYQAVIFRPRRHIGGPSRLVYGGGIESKQMCKEWAPALLNKINRKIVQSWSI